jgi:hypothetical protein
MDKEVKSKKSFRGKILLRGENFTSKNENFTSKNENFT